MKNKNLLLFAVAGVLVLGLVFLNQNLLNQARVKEKINLSTSKSEPVHYHAAFHHYKDGQLQDYSDFRFMSVQPCLLDEDSNHEHENILEQVHLHEGNGEVVHVHAEGITWRHLFTSLGIELENAMVYREYETKWILVQEGLDRQIDEYERVLVLENTEFEKLLPVEVPTVEDIKKAESISELCGS